MKRKLLLILVSVLITFIFVTGCGVNNKKTSGENNKNKVIKVATSPVFAPASYRNEKGELAGFEHDVFEEIGKRIGRTVEWVPLEGMDSLFGSLDAGKVDTIAFQISINEERKRNFKFSDVYGYNQIFLTVRDDFKYDTLDDLKGYKVRLDPTHALYPILMEYNKNLSEKDKIKVVPADGGSSFELVEQGKCDAFPMTIVALKEVLKKKNYKVKIGGKPVVIEENAYPFSKDVDPKLLKEINSAISSMLKDGTMKKISEEHYKIDVTKANK